MSDENGRWMAAKVRDGPDVPCFHCEEPVKSGQWQKGYRMGGWYRVYHDSCSEDVGSYGPDFAIGGKYGTKPKGKDSTV